MNGSIKAWGVRRREIDKDKLALAYYMLAKAIIDEKRQRQGKVVAEDPGRKQSSAGQEAA
jgi:hypothetical protein